MADDLGEELAVGLLGQSVERAAQQAIQGGADRVYAVTNPLLADYQADLYLAAIETLCRETSPNIILIGRTEEGRELAPRLAFRLGVGLAQDCLEVSVDPDSKRLLANRPVYGGNAVGGGELRIHSADCGGAAQGLRAQGAGPVPAGRGSLVPGGPGSLTGQEPQSWNAWRRSRRGSSWRTPGWWSPAAEAWVGLSPSRDWSNWPSFWAAPWGRPVRRWTLGGFPLPIKWG